MRANKKLSFTVIKLFLTGRKLNILLVFISQFYFKELKIRKIKEESIMK